MAKKDFYIMIVDDEESIRSILYEVLSSEGYNVITAESAEKALEILEKDEDLPHIIMTDIRMPGMSGVEFAKKVKKEISPDIEVIIMTSYASLETAQEAIKVGVYDYINKPFKDLSEVKTLILRVINKIYLRMENKHLLEKLKLNNEELTRVNQKINEINKDIATMYEFGQELLVLLNQDEIIDKFLQYVGNLLEDTLCVFLKYHVPKNALVVRHLYVKSDKHNKEELEKLKNIGMSLGESSDIVSLIEKIENHPALKTLVKKLFNTETYMTFSLSIRSTPVGVLLLIDKKELNRREESIINQYLNQLEITYDKAILHSKVKELAIRDGLTGLYNHRFCQERLELEVSMAKRLLHPLSIIFFDIDHFKNYNDVNGHPAGDMLLRSISSLLKKTFRSTDILCRYGGEEFCIILTHTPLQGAAIKAERLRKLIEETTFPNQDKQPNGNLTISIGVSEMPTHSINSNELIKIADNALYKVKETTRNRVMIGEAAENYKPAYEAKKVETKNYEKQN